MGNGPFAQVAFCTCPLCLQITRTATEVTKQHHTGCRAGEVFFILRKSKEATGEGE